MLSRIIFQLAGAIFGVAASIGNITRILIAAGLGRARISVLWAAAAATAPKAIEAVARTRLREQITITSIESQRIISNTYNHSVSFNIPGNNTLNAILNTNTASLSQEMQMRACIQVIEKSSGLWQMTVAQVTQEKFTALQNLCSGLPVAVVAFFLGTPPVGADGCFPDTGFFTERVYGWAETNATARLSSSGLWELDPLQVTEKIGIGDAIANMDQQFYNELLAWKNGLNVFQVLGEIESQGNTTGVNSFQEISNQANAWVNSLNSGQAQPAGKISIQGNTNLSNTILNPSVTFKYLRVDIGNIDKETSVPVVQQFPCDSYSFSCSSADQLLKSPFYNCVGFTVINNGVLEGRGFSMGNADTSSSEPTLSSLLVPAVINGKLIQAEYGHFYTNEEQITGTSPFWTNQAGSIQERFFLCGASSHS
jgi:hypothetical protein